MPVPSSISSLSQTPGSNSPSGSESPTTFDDYMRTIFAFIAQLRDGVASNEVDVASATTTDIGAANSSSVRITGTTAITSFGANYSGPRFVRFGGALTLTHNASTLNLPGAANITTVAGDRAIITPIGTPASGWQVLVFQRGASIAAVAGANNDITSLSALTAGGLPANSVTPANLSQKPTLGTSQALTSGTSKTFPINSWAKEINIAISGLSTNGTSQQLLRVRVAGTAVVAGYLGSTTQLSTATTSSLTPTSGFALVETTVAAATYHGTLTLILADAATNRWSYSSALSRSDVGASNITNGSITLSGPLDGVILTTLGGVDTFDAGLANTLEIG